MRRDEDVEERGRHSAGNADDQHRPGEPLDLRGVPGPDQARQRQDQGIFPDIVEDHRRQKGVERPADHPAQRHPEIELGQPGGIGPAGDQPLVTHQRGQEEGRQVDRQLDRKGVGGERRQHHAGGKRRGLQQQGDVGGDRRAGLEGEDEAGEVQGQGQHPQERRGGHVGGDVAGHAQHQAGGDGGQRHPDQPIAPGNRRGPLGWEAEWRARAPRTDHGYGQAAHQQDELAVSEAPAQALGVQRQHRFNDQRIGEQRQQAAEVAGGVECVGLAALPVREGSRVPSLDQRRGGRQRGEGRADRNHQHPKQPDGRVGRGRRPEQLVDP